MRFSCYITALRLSSLLLSLISLACHVAQCILFGVYRGMTNIPDWLTAGHWQYLLWYISLSMSLLGSSTICLYAIYNRYYKKPSAAITATTAFLHKNEYSIDKWLGIISFLPIFCSTVTVTAVNDPSLLEPWTNNLVKLERTPFALFHSCSALTADVDRNYPLLYQRCILSDLLWILAVSLCMVWSILVCLAFLATTNRKRIETRASKHVNRSFTTVDHHRSGMTMTLHTIGAGMVEPNWGRYLPDPPSTMYSAATLNSRTGLLTPISTLTKEKHLEFYAKCQQEYEDDEDEKYNLRGKHNYHSYDDNKPNNYGYFPRASDEKWKLQQRYGDEKSYGTSFDDKNYTTHYSNWPTANERTTNVHTQMLLRTYRAPSPLKDVYQSGGALGSTMRDSSLLHQLDDTSRKPSHSISKEKLIQRTSITSTTTSGSGDGTHSGDDPYSDKLTAVESLTVGSGKIDNSSVTRTPLYSKFSAKRSQEFKLFF